MPPRLNTPYTPRETIDDGMVLLNELSQSAFLNSLFIFPILAIALGLFGHFKWLVWTFGIQICLLVITLTTLAILVRAGRYPGYTGMDGIALFLLPAFCLASVLVSFLLFKMSRWIRSRY